MAEKAKVQITLSPGLLDEIDDYAEQFYTSRSGVITQACTQMFASVRAQKALASLAVTMKKIADSGEITEEAKQELDDFQRLAALWMGAS